MLAVWLETTASYDCQDYLHPSTTTTTGFMMPPLSVKRHETMQYNLINNFTYNIFHFVYASHTTLYGNNWILSISTSSHFAMGSSNHKIIIWGPLPVYNHRCNSPSHLFAFSFWLRPQCICQPDFFGGGGNCNWFLWQHALFNKKMTLL